MVSSTVGSQQARGHAAGGGGDDGPFDWAPVWAAMGVAPDGERGVNIAVVAISRHVREGRGDLVAVRWLGRDPVELDEPVDLTYAVLDRRTNRFASALRRHGFGPGTGVATLLGRVPDLFVAAFGALKSQCVVTPLFAAFGPRPIEQRLRLGQVQVLVTTPLLYRRKIAGILDGLPDLRLILICGATEDQTARGNGTSGVQVVSMGAFLQDGVDEYDVERTDAATPALLHFTSGTTGPPKGAVHVHGAVVAHHHTGRLVLDLHPGDVYWCTADPGWVTGTSYGLIAPLTAGATSIVDEGELDAGRWFHILERQSVDVLYTSPTALRMLRRAAPAGPAVAPGTPRLVATVGEALDADTVRWSTGVFGCPVLDTWWQTETGSIMIANRLGEPVRAGSMGRPIPGVHATLLARHDDGSPVLGPDGAAVEATGGTGELAIRRGWPSMFRAYLRDDDRYCAAFVGDWYRTGDLARRDDDGYFWFVGRGDDLIKTAGHFVGPAEVESVLEEHPAVTEVGVVGTPDPAAGAVVKAFVVLGDDAPADEGMRRDLLAFCRARLGASIAPRDIAFVEALPHNLSGKIMRRSLAARERGGADADPTALRVGTEADRER